MTWEEKLVALKGICYGAHLYMREPGNWYLSLPATEVKKGGMLSSAGEAGSTPEEAVCNTWSRLTEGLSEEETIVIDAYGETRQQVRWNGFMWAVDRLVRSEARK